MMMKAIALMFFSLVVVVNTTRGQKVDEKNVPENIRAVAAAQCDGDAVNMWVLDTNRNKYVASVLSETVFKTIEVSLAGKWIATTVALQEKSVPDPVMITVREKYLNKGLEAMNFLFVRDSKEGSFYAVELGSDDMDLYLTLDEKGHVLRERKDKWR